MKRAKNYYEILRVSPSASTEQIKARFRQLVKEKHPDVRMAAMKSERGGGGTDSERREASEKKQRQQTREEEEFLSVMEAFETLSDPEKRDRYDAKTLPRPHVVVKTGSSTTTKRRDGDGGASASSASSTSSSSSTSSGAGSEGGGGATFVDAVAEQRAMFRARYNQRPTEPASPEELKQRMEMRSRRMREEDQGTKTLLRGLFFASLGMVGMMMYATTMAARRRRS